MKRYASIIGLTVVFAAICSALGETNAIAHLLSELTEPAPRGIHPSRRDTAFRELLARNGRANPKATVNHVVVCPQPDGTSLYAVFGAHLRPLSEKMGAGHGRAIGFPLLFNSEGEYDGLRTVTKDQLFRDINQDGVIEHVWSTGTGFPLGRGIPGVNPGPDVLYVVPVIRGFDFHTATNLNLPLVVAYNYPTDRSGWNWRVLDADGDGTEEIQFGSGNPFEAAVTYAWSKAEGAYVGPEGGQDQCFQRIFKNDRKNMWNAFKAFAEARRKHAEQDGSTVPTGARERAPAVP